MKIDDLVTTCLCGCLRLVHQGEGACTSCKCLKYRRDDHLYPVSVGPVTS